MLCPRAPSPTAPLQGCAGCVAPVPPSSPTQTAVTSSKSPTSRDTKEKRGFGRCSRSPRLQRGPGDERRGSAQRRGVTRPPPKRQHPLHETSPSGGSHPTMTGSKRLGLPSALGTTGTM